GDGVGDLRGGPACADAERFEVAAGDAGDVRGQAGGVGVDVLAVAGGDGERAGGGAVGDTDVALVGVDVGHTLRGIRQRRREHVARTRALVARFPYTTLFRSGDGVGDLRGGPAGADAEALEVAAGDAGDVRGQAG